MDPLIAPPLDAATVERGVGRPAERRAPPPAHQVPADKIIDRDQVPCGSRGCDDVPDFGRQLRCYPFVGIDLEDPFAAAGVDPGVAARPFPLPGALDETLGKAQRDLARAIAAAVEHDDDLVGKAETGETVRELAFF